RPERRNALSEAQMTELIRALRTIGDAGEARAVVLAAAGPVFSSGHAFADLVERDRGGRRRRLATGPHRSAARRRMPQPALPLRSARAAPPMTGLPRAVRPTGDAGEPRAVVLAAAGPVFSSGHDFADMVERDLDGMRRLLATCTDLMLTIQRIPQPVVAQVQGVATAAGCQLVASCDLAVAAEEASFATPGGKGGWFC